MITADFTPPAPPAPPAVAAPRRFTKRHVALLLLLPVLVAVWIPVLSGPARPAAPAVRPEVAAPPAAPAGETAAAAPPLDAGGLTERLRQRVSPYEPRWSPGRSDPFVPTTSHTAPKAVAAPPAPVPPPEIARRDLVPSAVLIAVGEQPVAIIGGHGYRPGDVIDGHRIVAIEERRVVFRAGERTFALSIPAPTLPGSRP